MNYLFQTSALWNALVAHAAHVRVLHYLVKLRYKHNLNHAGVDGIVQPTLFKLLDCEKLLLHTIHVAFATAFACFASHNELYHLIQAARLREALAAHAAHVWSMILVDVQDVDAKTIALLERTATDILKRSSKEFILISC